MNDRFFAFFSGFPDRHFTFDVSDRLALELERRESIAFVSAWPSDFDRNDEDLFGMHELFAERGIPFARRYVIDERTDAAFAAALIKDASCVFLMGGHPGLQMKLLKEKGLIGAVRDSDAAVLGISAGSINMGRRSLDTKDSPIPYDGLGLADITVKPHFDPNNKQLISLLSRISFELPIFAMEDDSAIFVKGDDITYSGRVHRICKGESTDISFL